MNRRNRLRILFALPIDLGQELLLPAIIISLYFIFKLDHTIQKNIIIKPDSLAGTSGDGPHLIYTKDTRPVYSYV
jgi:hypothetical protein